MNTRITGVEFNKYIILPDNKQSERASAIQYDISLHEYGVLLSAGQQTKLVPWHLVTHVNLEPQPEPQSVIINAEEVASVITPVADEKASSATTEPSGAIPDTAASTGGGASKPAKKARRS